MSFRNPAFLLSADLPSRTVPREHHCTVRDDGKFDDTTRADMAAAMAAFRATMATKPLALFFHGGLVDKERGLHGAGQLLGPYSASERPIPELGLTTETWGNAYPYFFVWESGLLETLEQNLPGIASDAIFRRLLDIVGGKASSLVKGHQLPPADAMQSRTPTLLADRRPDVAQVNVTHDDIVAVQSEVERDPIILTERGRIAQAHAGPEVFALPNPAVDRYLSPNIIAAIVAEERLRDAARSGGPQPLWNPVGFGTLAVGAGNVLVRIVKRFRERRDHGFHNTVVEEILRQFYVSNIGAAIWGQMKRATAKAFRPATNTPGALWSKSSSRSTRVARRDGTRASCSSDTAPVACMCTTSSKRWNGR
jgi:hypothetical protein